MEMTSFDQISLIESILNSLPFSYVFWKNRDGIYMGASANQLKAFDSGRGFVGRNIYEILNDYETAKAVDDIDKTIISFIRQYKQNSSIYFERFNPGNFEKFFFSN